ncbi:MAG: ABC transporter permease [Maritimibacter sp.]|uniref:ABC transporter permease n=1 Tax=Maritimibacter sp. TaxID=2003363 RepID=UPI001D418271|nr:ABC transporter permease [Maritimibacter sp.]MBL6428599.1 ABC transporter permease [Maritimibacter sp.]
MTLTGIAALNLTHRPWRTGLTLLGVVLAIAAYVALLGLVKGIEGTLVESFSSRGTDVVLTEAGAADVLSSVVPVGLVDEVAQVEGVAAAAPELGRMTTVGENTTSFIIGWPADAFGMRAMEIVEGRFPLPEDRTETVAGGITLGTRLAERLDVGVGDLVEVFAADFVVTGLYTSEGVMAMNGALTLIEDMQAQTYRDGQATSIVVQLSDDLSPVERDAAIARLSERFPDLSVDPTETLVQEYSNLRIATILAWVVSTVAVASAALAVLNTMAMAVNERRGEIAILGAVGWPRGRIVRLLMLEGAWLTIAGSALGILVGIAVAWIVAWSPQVEGFVEPVIDGTLLIRAVAIGLGIGLIGAYVPAIRAASEDPASILRGK